MPNKRYKAEPTVTLLRQIEVGIVNGKTTPQACKEVEITVQTYYRWRKEYGGLKLDQAKRFKELERENAKLKRSGAILLHSCLSNGIAIYTPDPLVRCLRKRRSGSDMNFLLNFTMRIFNHHDDMALVRHH
jgi:hypothetical protein